MMLKRLWKEEDGVLVSLEIILAAMMLVFGLLAGMQVLRDAAALELADLGQAIGAINNSFRISGITGPGTNGSGVMGSEFVDATDSGDVAPAPLGLNGLTLGIAGNPEGTAFP